MYLLPQVLHRDIHDARMRHERREARLSSPEDNAALDAEATVLATLKEGHGEWHVEAEHVRWLGRGQGGEGGE